MNIQNSGKTLKLKNQCVAATSLHVITFQHERFIMLGLFTLDHSFHPFTVHHVKIRRKKPNKQN